MAMTDRNKNVQSFEPRWPDLTALPKERVQFTYDRPSDTLFVDFYGSALPGASIPLDRGDRDYLFVRIDPESDAVVGLQIEHFLIYAIHRHPELAAALDVATLVGTDRESLGRVTHIDAVRTKELGAALIEDIFRLSA